MGDTFKGPDTVKGDVRVALMSQLNILSLVCRPVLVSGACWSGGKGVAHLHCLVAYKLESVNMIMVAVARAGTREEKFCTVAEEAR